MSLTILTPNGQPVVKIEDDGTILDPDGTEHMFEEDFNDDGRSKDGNIPADRAGVQTDQQGTDVPTGDKKAVDPAS